MIFLGKEIEAKEKRRWLLRKRVDSKRTEGRRGRNREKRREHLFSSAWFEERFWILFFLVSFEGRPRGQKKGEVRKLSLRGRRS